jgi:formylglycine-generating enzyme required for sulfatase activity
MQSLARESRLLQAFVAVALCVALPCLSSCKSPQPEQPPPPPAQASFVAPPVPPAVTIVDETVAKATEAPKAAEAVAKAAFVDATTEAPKVAEAAAKAAESVDPALTPAVVWLLPPAIDIPEAKAATEADMKPYKEKIPGTDVTFEMIPVRGDKFTMGSPDAEAGRSSDEGPQHEVEVEAYWIGKCEVTWDEYALWGLGSDKFRRQMRGVEPTSNDTLADAITQPTSPYADMSFGMGKDRRPAICMTQLAAKMYCKWLSAKTGRYYRLPTEAEWEYACRAGSKSVYSFGDDPAALGDYAWFAGNSQKKYQQVGQKKPNAWGLYDMHGNVAEWVLDGYKSDGYAEFAGKTAKNPLTSASEIYSRVVRGGSWRDKAPSLRSSYRERSGPSWTEQDPQNPQSIWYHTDADFVGFRVIRPFRTPSAEEAAKLDVDDLQKTNMDEYLRARGFK